jgi:hypothetical protein
VLARTGIALAAVMAAVLAACGTNTVPTVPSNAPDTSPPAFSIDFYDFPDQSPTHTESPINPLSYTFPPGGAGSDGLRAQIDHRYSVVAKLSDPESGIRFFEIREIKGAAGCFAPGSTQASKGLIPRNPQGYPAGYHDNGEQYPTPTPDRWPTERLIAFTFDTFVDGHCAAGERVFWTIVLGYSGLNGVALPPPGITVSVASPTGSPSYGGWDTITKITIRNPDPP